MIIAIFWILTGCTLLGFYNALLLKDDKMPEDDPRNKQTETNWHYVGAALFLYLSLTAWVAWGIEYVFFSLSCFWTLFAGIVHKVGLNKPFFYVGTTAKTDRLLRQLFPQNPEKGSAILKLGTLIASLIFIIIN